jgi:hypothetical protein
MITLSGIRTSNEIKAVKNHPNIYAKGYEKGVTIYDKGFPYKYLCKVMENRCLFENCITKGYSYTCGLYEGYKESEENDIKTMDIN